MLTDGDCGEERLEVRKESKMDDMLTGSDKKPLCSCSQKRFYGHVSRGRLGEEEGLRAGCGAAPIRSPSGDNRVPSLGLLTQ
jgi:hypothetical protein